MLSDLIQPWWSSWMAQRWGFGDHCCHLWATTGLVYPQLWKRTFGGLLPGPVEVIVIYRELLEQGKAEADLANAIVGMTPEAERRKISRFYLGSESLDLQGKKRGLNGVAQIIGEILSHNGLPKPWTADQNRVDGWRFLYACLRQAELCGMEKIPESRLREGPILLISSECSNCIENIPQATRSDKDPNDIEARDTEWAAVTDAVRFLLKSKPSAKAEAPAAIRRQELCESIPDPTSRHMALVRFNEQERQRGRTARPTWRNGQ